MPFNINPSAAVAAPNFFLSPPFLVVPSGGAEKRRTSTPGKSSSSRVWRWSKSIFQGITIEILWNQLAKAEGAEVTLRDWSMEITLHELICSQRKVPKMGIERQLKKVKIPGLSALATDCLLDFLETSFEFSELAPHYSE